MASLGHNEPFLDIYAMCPCRVHVIYVSNCHLYIDIIIFPYIDNSLQFTIKKKTNKKQHIKKWGRLLISLIMSLKSMKILTNMTQHDRNLSNIKSNHYQIIG